MNLAKLRKFTKKGGRNHPWSKLMSDGEWIYATDGSILVRTSHKPERVKAQPVVGIDERSLLQQELVGPPFRPLLIHNNKRWPEAIVEIIPGVSLNPDYIRLMGLLRGIICVQTKDFPGLFFRSDVEKCEGFVAGCV